MAYSSPSARATSDVISATIWNQDVVDNVAWVAEEKPRARVYNSASVAHTSSGSWQSCTFNSERYDVGGCHSTSSNTSRLTVPTGGGGLYVIGGCIAFAANSTGIRGIRILLNGTTALCEAETDNLGASLGVALSVTTDHELAAGDYVELQGFQNSGSNLNMLALARSSPEFWFRWVATAS